MNFDFYEKCAVAVPRIRKFLNDNIRSMPRERVYLAVMTPSYVKYFREWGFLQNNTDYSFLRVIRPSELYASQPKNLGTLKRYRIDTLLLRFGKAVRRRKWRQRQSNIADVFQRIRP